MRSFIFHILFTGLLLSLLMSSCEPIQLYEQNTIYPQHEWSSKQVNHYQFAEQIRMFPLAGVEIEEIK